MRMSTCLNIAAALVLAPVTACSAPGGDNEAVAVETDHLRCAALTSAADTLMRVGAVPTDEALLKRVLVSGMTHLNAYAIPRKLTEKEAFTAVNAHKARILGTEAPASVIEQARACVARTPTG